MSIAEPRDGDLVFRTQQLDGGLETWPTRQRVHSVGAHVATSSARSRSTFASTTTGVLFARHTFKPPNREICKGTPALTR
jgi:hypothetical protein